MKGLSGKRVLVTGGAQGIGHAIAERFLLEGSSVFLTDAISEDELSAANMFLSRKYEGRLIAAHMDVANESAVRAAFAKCKQALGGLDVLVNNAGINRQSPSHLFPTDDFDRVMSINLRGAFLSCREAISLFLEQGHGIILNNSSNHETVPKPEFLAYSASKGALGNLTRTIALEYADRGIRANAVAPGATVTPLNASWTDDPIKKAKVEAHIPLGRAATAAEIAAVFAFLASDEASYITGQTIYVDGGLALHTDFKSNWSS